LCNRRRVTDDEHSRCLHDPKKRVNERPPRAVGFGPQHCWNRRCRDPRRPHHRGARDFCSAGDNALLVDCLDLDSGQYLHAELREPPGYPAGQWLNKSRQDPVTCI